MGKIKTLNGGQERLSKANQTASFFNKTRSEFVSAGVKPILFIGLKENGKQAQLMFSMPEAIRDNKLALLYYLEQAAMATEASLSEKERELLEKQHENE